MTRMWQTMRRSRFWGAVVALAPLLVGEFAGAHQLTPANTQVSLEIYQLGLHWFSAVFRELSGDFALSHDGQGGELNVSVRTDSIDCRNSYWNDRLRSPQWLDTAKYPQMTYRSTRIEFADAAHATVQGELTLHGVTRPLTLTVTDIDCDLSPTSTRRVCRFVGHAQLRRSDFGLPHGFWTGGDVVDIVVRGH